MMHDMCKVVWLDILTFLLALSSDLGLLIKFEFDFADYVPVDEI